MSRVSGTCFNLLEDNIKNLVAAALLSVTALSGFAYAQTAQSTDRTTPAVTTSNNADKLMLKSQWRASKLMGLNVYTDVNEKLGNINELILDKDGTQLHRHLNRLADEER